MSKIIVFFIVSCAVLPSVNLFANNSENISIHHGKYNDYYHIKYTLTKNNFEIPEKSIVRNGQFEILLYKDKFPIPANNCNNKLILRMPSTLSDSKKSKDSIRKKLSLYNQIKSIYTHKKGSLDVVIELNPYVTVKSENPLHLELDGCNIFFRTIKNNYVDTLSNINSTDELLKGYYTYGHEVNTFQPCGEKKVYWVVSSNETLKILIQNYMKYTSKPYEEVFVKIMGKFFTKESDGFAMDYEGQIFVEKIIMVDKKSSSSCY